MSAAASATRKRPASYYREYRARKRAEAEAAALAESRLASGAPVPLTESDVNRAIGWIESALFVPSGPLAGQPFRVPDWQRAWLRAASADGIREAGLSVARKNGKSGLIAAWLLAILQGPLNRRDYRVIVSSLTGLLAKELRNAVEQTAQASGMRVTVAKSPPPGIIHGDDGAYVQFLAADRASGHALGADLALIDEAGLLRENQRGLWNALYTAISGRNGRMWSISIRGEGPMFAELAAREGSEQVHFREYAAATDCDLEDPAAWKAANPGLDDGIKSIAYMRDASERARVTPSNEMHFRAFDLNQPVDPDRQVIVTVADYAACVVDHIEPPSGDLVVGIDLGGSASMTCAVAIDLASGAIFCRGAFPDDPPLSRRAERDRMGSLYDRMVREGELRLYPGRVTPVVPFLRDFFGEVGRLGRIVAVGADRYRRAEAEAAFKEANLPGYRVEWRGQGSAGTADGSHDVRAFQRYVMERRMRSRGSTMLESAIASSVLRFDGAGNPALDKAANNARIDALSAAVIAAGIAELIPEAPLLKMHVV